MTLIFWGTGQCIISHPVSGSPLVHSGLSLNISALSSHVFITNICCFIIFQCAINGVKFDKLQKGSGKNATKLEMFFSGFPKIIGMEYFPNLQSLMLMGQQIAVLENLDCLPNLTELCVSESKLTVSRIE